LLLQVLEDLLLIRLDKLLLITLLQELLLLLRLLLQRNSFLSIDILPVHLLVHCLQPPLRPRVALLRRRLVVSHGWRVVLLHAQPELEHVAEGYLAVGEAEHGPAGVVPAARYNLQAFKRMIHGASVLERRWKIRLSPAALLQHAARAVQRGSVALVSRSHVQPQRFLIVLRNAPALLVQQRQVHLSLSTPCICCRSIQTRSHGVIGLHSPALQIHFAQREESGRQPLQGSKPVVPGRAKASE
jgi:hypothetical protein